MSGIAYLNAATYITMHVVTIHMILIKILKKLVVSNKSGRIYVIESILILQCFFIKM